MKRLDNKSAFTLVELLCVCAILVLLVALLLPALDAAVDRGQIAACSSQQRQLSIGWHAYSGDNNGIALSVSYQAQSGVPNESYDVLWKLEPYCGYAVWRCPAAPTEYYIDYYGRWVGTYGISTFLTQTTPASNDPFRMSQVTYPSTTAFLADRLYSGPPNLYTKYPNGCCAWNAIAYNTWENSPWALHGPWLMTGVKSKTNVTRVDGSVRTYLYSEIVQRQWCFATLFGLGPGGVTTAGRAYLWNGLASGTSSAAGWLKE